MSNNDKKDVVVWADRAMYTAVPTAHNDEPVVPTVTLLAAQADPLGAVAASSLMYLGQPIRHLSEVTDDQRREFFEDIKRTQLDSPFEFIDFHFIIEGVTRAFTHQMVRQRVGAVYVQESQRFAVKENGAHEVAMPPSLQGTLSLDQLVDRTRGEYAAAGLDPMGVDPAQLEQMVTGDQRQRLRWDEAQAQITRAYMDLVNSGMPAEDARGLLPTNITTRIHYKTNLRALIQHAGNRLCTQAQFEWRVVWAGIVQAIRDYGEEQTYQRTFTDFGDTDAASSAWQFEELSRVFAPVCYNTGKCEFMSNMDRHCNIRERVQEYAANGVPSSDWPQGRVDLGIPAIRAEEWLADPASARIRAEAK
jgi:flavin-dependent thymidylate synthase